jgi:hypothetical protein
LPEYALLHLARQRTVSVETGPAAALAGPGSSLSGIWFERETIEAFGKRMVALVCLPDGQTDLQPLHLLLRESRKPGVWTSALDAILEEQLHV